GSFGSGGEILDTDSGGGGGIQGIAVQPDGKYVVAGLGNLNGSSFQAARYNSDGTVDRTFGTNGRLTTAFAGQSSAGAFALLLQPDYQIVVAGTSNVLLARYNNDVVSRVASVPPVAGTPQDAPINTAFPVPLRVQVLDPDGNPASQVPVTFAGPTSGPGVTFPYGNTAITNATGEAYLP